MSASPIIAVFRRIPPALLIAGLLFTAAAASPARAAATIDITGLTSAGGGIGDSYLYNNQPDGTVYGSSDVIEVGTENSGADIYRGVFRFQLDKILSDNPALAGATITNVELILTLTETATTAGSLELHQTGQSFAEASTTWTNRATNPPSSWNATWGLAGGNLSGPTGGPARDTVSIASGATAGTQVSFDGAYFTSAISTAIMNESTAESDWVIKATDESAAGSALFSFGSRDPDNKNTAAPILRITYTSIPEPSTTAMIFAGVAALALSRTRRRFFGHR